MQFRPGDDTPPLVQRRIALLQLAHQPAPFIFELPFGHCEAPAGAAFGELSAIEVVSPRERLDMNPQQIHVDRGERSSAGAKAHKLGVMGRATYNNIEQMQQQYIDDGLTPITRRLEDQCDSKLLFDAERDEYAISWDYTAILRGDQLARYQAYQIGLLNGFLNRNEVRAKENLNPVPDGETSQ